MNFRIFRSLQPSSSRRIHNLCGTNLSKLLIAFVFIHEPWAPLSRPNDMNLINKSSHKAEKVSFILLRSFAIMTRLQGGFGLQPIARFPVSVWAEIFVWRKLIRAARIAYSAINIFPRTLDLHTGNLACHSITGHPDNLQRRLHEWLYEARKKRAKRASGCNQIINAMMLDVLLSALLLDRLHNFSGLAQGLIDFFQSDDLLGMRSIAAFVVIEPSPEMLEIHRSGSCCERKFFKEAISSA